MALNPPPTNIPRSFLDKIDVVGYFKELNNYLRQVSDRLKGTVPIGGIILWSGGDVPANYNVCDGTNGTVDLSSVPVLGLNYIQRIS